MAAVIDFEVFGEKQVSRELYRFAGRAIEAEPAFQEIANKMRHAIEEQFESQGQHGSGGWGPLKATTIARKSALGHDPRILHATLALSEALTGPDNWDIHAEGLELHAGGDTWYGIVHQKGSDAANIPVRKPVDFTEIERQEFVKILQEYLMGGHE